MASPRVTLYPLGGLGEIGMNCMVLDTGDTMLVIDCGLRFPEEHLYGVDVVIPRFDFIIANKDRLAAIICTHAHEDHIGALAWLLPYVDAPVYSSRFTLSLISNRLREHDLERYVELKPVAPGDRVEFGPLAVTFFQVCHSIIHGFGLGIETPAGRIVHTGDFKIDRNPLYGQRTDLDAFGRFAADGVEVLLSDSTNVEREGFTLAESEIKESFGAIFSKAPGRVLVSLFSSHVQRMQEIFELAEQLGRKVAVSGRSMLNNIEAARQEGFLSIADGVFISLESIHEYPDEELILLVTGSQGEPLSALSRLAAGEHRQLRIHKGDLVILSSRFIPGNTRAITRVMNHLYRLGAEVLYEKIHGIHASGHAHSEELALMLDTVSPRFFIPVHGEYRHLVKHSRLAVERGVAPERALVIEDGQPVTFTQGGMRLEDNIPVDSIMVDGKGVGDVGHTVLKERRLLAGEGLVIVNLVIDENSWELTMGPDIVSKGFIFEQHYAHVLEDAKCIVLDIFENVKPGATGKLRDRVRSHLRRFFRKVLDRDPVVIPVIIVL